MVGESRQRCTRYCVSNLVLSMFFFVPFRDPQDRVYNKTLEYVKTFAKFNTTDSASVVSEEYELFCRTVYSI